MSFNIPATDNAPNAAREAVRSVIGESEAAGDVLLATSELVSNAVLHGELSPDDEIVIDVSAGEDQVRVAVKHRGFPFQRPPGRPGGQRPGGFGFHIVGALARRWDITHRNGTTESWFEI